MVRNNMLWKLFHIEKKISAMEEGITENQQVIDSQKDKHVRPLISFFLTSLQLLPEGLEI